MTLPAAPKAAVDLAIRVVVHRHFHSATTGKVLTEVDLVLLERHVGAARGFVVNLVVAVGLLVSIQDETCHASLLKDGHAATTLK